MEQDAPPVTPLPEAAHGASAKDARRDVEADDAATGSAVAVEEARAERGRLEGIVTGTAPGFFEVAAGGVSYLCTLRGRLRASRPLPPALAARRGAMTPAGRPAATAAKRSSTPTRGQDEAEPAEIEPQRPARIAPGDRVVITVLSAGEGVIEDVLPRRTVLARYRRERRVEQVMLANPDLAVLVFATREPEPHFGLLDRYLALCDHADVQPILCINKDDLGVPGEVGASADLYGALGYPVIYTSATTGDGIPALRQALAGKISLLTGESGVGKSSLTNLIVPDAQQRVGALSEATGLGRHTTTGVRLLPLPEGGWLADSAGIRELSLWNVPSAELARCFVELRAHIGECLYEDCTHSADEEGCALRAAQANGEISASRWSSFERLLQEARAEEKPEWSKR